MSDSDDRPPSIKQGVIGLDVCASDASDDRLVQILAGILDRAVGVLATETALAGEVRVRLVRDAEMATLHERHSGIPGTTDVLTFDLRENPGDPRSPLDVDLILCVDEACRQAAARSIPVEHELTLYAIHGILHTLGHDDHSDDGYREMHAREDRILTVAGLGAVFSAPETQESSQ